MPGPAQAQVQFTNLNFELASVPYAPARFGGVVTAEAGLPGWTPFSQNFQTPWILHNVSSSGGEAPSDPTVIQVCHKSGFRLARGNTAAETAVANLALYLFYRPPEASRTAFLAGRLWPMNRSGMRALKKPAGPILLIRPRRGSASRRAKLVFGRPGPGTDGDQMPLRQVCREILSGVEADFQPGQVA